MTKRKCPHEPKCVPGYCWAEHPTPAPSGPEATWVIPQEYLVMLERDRIKSAAEKLVEALERIDEMDTYYGELNEARQIAFAAVEAWRREIKNDGSK